MIIYWPSEICTEVISLNISDYHNIRTSVMDQNEISSSTSTKKPNTRNKLCPDIDFPSVHTQEWKYSGHLLTWAEIIGGVIGLVSKKVSAHQACTSISKIAEDHWIQRNVYPISWQSIHKQLYKDYLEFMNVRKLIRALTQYKQLKDITNSWKIRILFTTFLF